MILLWVLCGNHMLTEFAKATLVLLSFETWFQAKCNCAIVLLRETKHITKLSLLDKRSWRRPSYKPIPRVLLNVFVNSLNKSLVVNCPEVNIASSNSLSFATWHSRLGHPSADAIKIVFKLCNFPTINKTTYDFCSHCYIGKSHRLPSSLSISKYLKPFELVFTDLWCHAPFPSDSGFKYYVTFVDAHTIFTWLYLLKNKCDTLTISKQFKAMMDTQFNLPIKVVQSNWGREYRPFTKFFTDLGILHHLIFPHTP